MIDNGDSEPRFMTADMAPQFIAFQAQGEVVGKLHLTNPMTFEGDADKCAAIFFKHVIVGADRMHQMAKRLIEAAQCPNESCDLGVIPRQVAEDEWEAEQCQWCHERDLLLIGDGDEKP